jgi:hypothetical protein
MPTHLSQKALRPNFLFSPSFPLSISLRPPASPSPPISLPGVREPPVWPFSQRILTSFETHGASIMRDHARSVRAPPSPLFSPGAGEELAVYIDAGRAHPGRIGLRDGFEDQVPPYLPGIRQPLAISADAPLPQSSCGWYLYLRAIQQISGSLRVWAERSRNL